MPVEPLNGTAELRFVEPRRGLRPEDCFFYHVCDLPGVGQVGGHWDLRGTVDSYLGGVNFAGKTVLDVGTASGFLTFEMEKRGATVTSFDVAGVDDTEIVPFWDDPCSPAEILAQQRSGFERLKNSYWFCHEKLGSKARAYYGNIHRLPRELGQFDIVMIGTCLPHIRDQLSALESIARHARDTVIISQPTLPDERPIAKMIAPAEGKDKELRRFAWWVMSDGCVKNFMGILGFKLQHFNKARHKCTAYQAPRMDECTTFVFRRAAAARIAAA
jgi:SAM-dependent methyltransferase